MSYVSQRNVTYFINIFSIIHPLFGTGEHVLRKLLLRRKFYDFIRDDKVVIYENNLIVTQKLFNQRNIQRFRFENILCKKNTSKKNNTSSCYVPVSWLASLQFLSYNYLRLRIIIAVFSRLNTATNKFVTVQRFKGKNLTSQIRNLYVC